MDQVATARTIDTVLTELEELVSLELGALTQLSAEDVERYAAIKINLDQELRGRSTEFEPRHRATLEGIATGLKRNHVLLVHARDQVLGTLALMSGSPSGLGGSGKLPSGAVRLNTRG